MPLILVAGAKIQCLHQGLVSIPKGDPKLTVSGSGAVTAGSEAGISFAPSAPGVLAPCTYTDPTSGAPAPCTTQAALSGASTILAVGGLAVLLETANGLAINKPPAPSPVTWKVADAGQKLLSVSK
jgi:hypothetical protein